MLITALLLILLLLLNYCVMYLPGAQEGNIGWACQYDRTQQRNVVIEYYKIENGQKVSLPINEDAPLCTQLQK